MGIQQWCFSFYGRIGRRDFWIWCLAWLLLMTVTFVLTQYQMISVQSAAFFLVFLLWPTAAVLTKRLHDRNKSGWWGLLLVLAWLLMAGNWSMLAPFWQWGVGRFIPTLILMMMLIDCGIFLGSTEENRFGKMTEVVNFRGYFRRKIDDAERL